MVGVFVIGAFALLIAGIIVFGKGQLFKETRDWILYFDGSLKGLSPGSAVVLQGVRIGDVKDVRVHIDKEGQITTPVIMTLDSSLIDFEEKDLNPKEELCNTKEMIDRGLRAQLQTQSLITGQLLIQLEFHSDKEARFVSPGGPLPEMPTIPSTVQELSKTLSELPLEDIVNNIHSITKNLDTLINSPDLNNGLAALSESLKKAESILTNIEEQITPISTEAQQVLKSADKLITENNGRISSLLDDLEKTSQTIRKSVEALSKDLNNITSKSDGQLTRLLKTATTTTEHAGKMIESQSQFRLELNKTLEELNSALRAVRLLAEYLEQNPESVIRGKKE